MNNPAKRDELLDDLLAWQKATGAKMATVPNPAYDPSAKGAKGKKGGKKKK